jgi:hypothetical protein
MTVQTPVDGDRHEEARAAAIVAAVTGCATRRLDVGNGAQLADFALVNTDGRDVGLLEVTSITAKSYSSFFSLSASQHRHWVDPGLRLSWLVTVDNVDRRLRGLRKRVSAALAALETTGVHWVDLSPEWYTVPVRPLPNDLAALGVVQARAVGKARAGGGFVAFQPPAVGGPFGIESLIEAYEAVLSLPDNRKKLAGAAGRRELFVWANPPSGAASALNTFSVEPWVSEVERSRPPVLPVEATAIWAALRPDGRIRLASALWRGDSAGWRVLDPPQAD